MYCAFKKRIESGSPSKREPIYEERFLSAVTAAAATATATAASGKAGFAWLGLVDFYTASTYFLPIKSLDGRVGIGVIHLDEAEPAGTAALAVGD